MASGGRTGYSHQAIPLILPTSGSIFLHNAQTLQLLFLSHLTTTFPFTVETPTAGWPRSWQSPGPGVTSSIRATWCSSTQQYPVNATQIYPTSNFG